MFKMGAKSDNQGSALDSMLPEYAVLVLCSPMILIVIQLHTMYSCLWLLRSAGIKATFHRQVSVAGLLCTYIRMVSAHACTIGAACSVISILNPCMMQ